MKMIKKVKMVEQAVITYLSNDGKEFDTMDKCKQHEEEMNKINKLLIHEDGYIPCDGLDSSENYVYSWYKVENEDQLNMINDYYNTDEQAIKFPEYVCIIKHEDFYTQDFYHTTLKNCKEYVLNFFLNGFGIKVTFEEVAKW